MQMLRLTMVSSAVTFRVGERREVSEIWRRKTLKYCDTIARFYSSLASGRVCTGCNNIFSKMAPNVSYEYGGTVLSFLSRYPNLKTYGAEGGSYAPFVHTGRRMSPPSSRPSTRLEAGFIDQLYSHLQDVPTWNPLLSLLRGAMFDLKARYATAPVKLPRSKEIKT